MAIGIKTGGRKKGVPNKLTASVKEMIMGALNEAGGKDYLLRQSLDNPTAFMTLVGKVLPLTLAGDKENPISTSLAPADHDLINRYLQQKGKTK